ncbi:protein NipSnap homolog 2-like [Halichondria panicea]|uniref:protein NipSnap homolog 2-like n=1 Tax=Halichondria panicea TaxID=6063 RepID=UPI00312B5D1E
MLSLCRSTSRLHGLRALVSRDGGLARLHARGLFGSKSDVPKKSQSRVLSKDEGHLFEMELHRVKPEYMEDYLKASGEAFLRVNDSPEIPAQLFGSWTTMVGPVQDQATHLWKYEDYASVSKAKQMLNEDKHWNEYLKTRAKMLDRRSSQVILPFAFWAPADHSTMTPKGLYEMRTYTLRPGTLIEWGQAWETGIHYRKDESIGGWFSQIGEMHQVHHLWAYKDLVDRQEMRQEAWSVPGWDECVMRTVPLIRYMAVRVLIPTAYSPLQ